MTLGTETIKEMVRTQNSIRQNIKIWAECGVHDCNPRTQAAEKVGLQVQDQL
jgi:hypothetical protein